MGIQTSLEIFSPNGQGKLGFETCSNLNLGNPNRFGNPQSKRPNGRTHADNAIAWNLQAELDAAEATGIDAGAARPSPGPSITIGGGARPSGASHRPARTPTGAPPTRLKRQKADRVPPSTDPISKDFVALRFRYPPRGGIRPRHLVTSPVVDTPLLTNLTDHPSFLVRRCEDPLESVARGGWSNFSQLLDVARREYREFFTELGFGPFLSIPYVHVYHLLVRCWVERFFDHTGTFHFSTCEMRVLPVDQSAILGIRFGGRVPLSEPVSSPEALDILGIDDPHAIVGTRSPSLRLQYLGDLLRRERDEPPTELRYRQWTAYFIFSCFLGNDKSTVPTPIVGIFRDVDTLRDRLPSAPDPAFPLARHWDSARIQRLTSCTLLECCTTLSRLRIWIRSPRFWELFMGERTVRQLGGKVVVPVDPPRLMTIEGYIPNTPTDSYVAGVDCHPDLVRTEVPYQEWFEHISLGPLMSLHEVEGGRVMGGMAMDSHHIRSSGEIDRLQSEILRLQLELSVSEDRQAADMDRLEIASRDAELAIRDASIQSLKGQLASLGIAPLTRASSSGHGQTSSPPPPYPVSRDWFFDDPSPS
uniref:Aminotransferase-like plant mobile domain-containing protein n=1 Tax=Fagus sylvatica TaxID=28930 RepID=A0A2N9HEU5_FAGSY